MKEEDTKEDKDSKQEDWMQKKWRPMMALMYMTVCAFDFIVFPIMFTVVQFWETQAANDAFRQWQPLTLSGAGLFHMAMGAVLGITAWSRGQEKIAGVATNMANTPQINNSNEAQPQPQRRVDPPFNNEQTLYSAAVPQEQPKVVTGYKGKPSPISGNDPLI